MTIKKAPIFIQKGGTSLNCCCDSGKTNDLKIEGDVGADPIWCNRCGCNLNIEDIPISARLVEELSYWKAKYGEWIDWDLDKLVPNGVELEERFNQRGLALAEKVKQELDSKYKIRYVASTSARTYDQS
ncbi:hypothetical protein NSA56_17005 [Oceanobacillus caeni]|uniref:hypothetical protein n=1 Tax=Oceanobacillus TaxID=182709 RepID=UPI000A93F388|nr:hypothetical protein [Oceanobacillus caeni]MCR1836038.1 hypothetical protein [Oceanobacillus caeni]MED4473878.1 hypothetical protein [Oceanobacillus caeni]